MVLMPKEGPNTVPGGRNGAIDLRFNGRGSFRGSFPPSLAVQDRISQEVPLKRIPALDAIRNHCMRSGGCRVQAAAKATGASECASLAAESLENALWGEECKPGLGSGPPAQMPQVASFVVNGE
jgi:hypothetical protein